jgi:hypothetical protein
MNRFSIFIYFVLITVCTLCITCTTTSLTGGTSTSENGRIMGRIVNQKGDPASKVRVQLYTSECNPTRHKTAISIDITDENGTYTFDSVPPGIHNIQSIDNLKGSGTLRFGISSAHDTIIVTPDTLTIFGSLECTFPGSSSDSNAYAYIPGTSLFAFVQNGRALIESIPSGSIPSVRFANNADSSKDHVIETNIAIISGNTARIHDLMSWKYTKKLYLNTTSSGADIAATVTAFPVLVRLSSGNFAFNQAKTDGSDVLFTKPDGTPLPSEIERWDAAAQKAEVWVNVDTIYGNDSTHFITMCWGNPDAAIVSNSAAVFDTSNNFISVWHMNEGPSAGVASVKDRTFGAHDATPFGSMSAENSIGGVIGKALSFDGADDYLNAGNISIPANYSIGLWVFMDTTGDYQRFIYKDSSYTLWYDKDSVSVRMEHMNTRWYGIPQDSGAHVPMTTGSWQYLTGTYDGNTIRLYKNGYEVSRSNVITEPPKSNSNPLFIGRSTNLGPEMASFVNGILDEIRIEGTARPADWIKLCYMNQRFDDKLLQFK